MQEERMVRRIGRVILAALAALAIAMPAAAQMGGMVRGRVLDDKGQPVVDASITITAVDTARKFQTKSDKRGEFMQIGLTSGGYTIVAEKDKLVSAQQKATVRAGSPAEVDLVIGVAAAASSADAAARTAALTKAFDEAVAAQKANNFDLAIEKFNEGITLNPNCFNCYNGLGRAYVGKKDYAKAEEALKKSIELRPNDAEAYSELANMYNAQRKFDLAAEAGKKASEFAGGGAAGGNADVLYNQGVILFNGGKSGEAKPLFEQVIQANPSHAEGHYMLGMTLVGENPAAAVTAFETYLKLAPAGPNAPMAKQFVDALKK
jgi:tetratricopeptide (TPR) repeat protein